MLYLLGNNIGTQRKPEYEESHGKRIVIDHILIANILNNKTFWHSFSIVKCLPQMMFCCIQ